MTTQHIIGDTTAFIVTKESMTKARDMLQACLEQSTPLIENGVIKGYSNDFAETEVSAFIASIDAQLKSKNHLNKPDLEAAAYDMARSLTPEQDTFAKTEAMEHFFSGCSTSVNAALAFDDLHYYDTDTEALIESLPPIRDEYQYTEIDDIIELVNDEYWRLKALMAKTLLLAGAATAKD
jgi:hypothetical protein